MGNNIISPSNDDKETVFCCWEKHFFFWMDENQVLRNIFSTVSKSVLLFNLKNTNLLNQIHVKDNYEFVNRFWE